jgi:hypothetical protein
MIFFLKKNSLDDQLTHGQPTHPMTRVLDLVYSRVWLLKLNRFSMLTRDIIDHDLRPVEIEEEKKIVNLIKNSS